MESPDEQQIRISLAVAAASPTHYLLVAQTTISINLASGGSGFFEFLSNAVGAGAGGNCAFPNEEVEELERGPPRSPAKRREWNRTATVESPGTRQGRDAAARLRPSIK
jgi:hypothetical protein